MTVDEAFDEIRDLISQETRVQGEYDWPEFYLSPEGETKLREILEKLA